MDSKLPENGIENSISFKVDATEENEIGVDSAWSELDEIQVMLCEDGPFLVDSIESLNDCLGSEFVILEALHNKRTKLQQQVKQILTEIEFELKKRGP